MTWQPIKTAPKDRDVLVWYDHDADPCHDPNNPKRLTDYGFWVETGNFLSGRGVTIAAWFPPEWEASDDYAYWTRAVWRSKGDDADYYNACNATHWMPLPDEPDPASQEK
jgi:hypothetical protein